MKIKAKFRCNYCNAPLESMIDNKHICIKNKLAWRSAPFGRNRNLSPQKHWDLLIKENGNRGYFPPKKPILKA